MTIEGSVQQLGMSKICSFGKLR